MLDDTLIVWGGEFGRTPFREGRTARRRGAFSAATTTRTASACGFAGGGIKAGMTHGESDELGFSRRPR